MASVSESVLLYLGIIISLSRLADRQYSPWDEGVYRIAVRTQTGVAIGCGQMPRQGNRAESPHRQQFLDSCRIKDSGGAIPEHFLLPGFLLKHRIIMGTMA